MINDDYSFFLIDHGNPEAKYVWEFLSAKTKQHVSLIQYENSYKETLASITSRCTTEYVWVCSSICNYTHFSFDEGNSLDNYITVFPSNGQKEGDTFYFRVEDFKDKLFHHQNLRTVGIHYANRIIGRLHCPVYEIQADTYAGKINQSFSWPYALFMTEKHDKNRINDQVPSLWDTKPIYVHSTGATSITVPQEACKIVKDELYDYPFIKFQPFLMKSCPMDIVFISNGEKEANQNYYRLLEVTKSSSNRICKVENIEGRANAYKAAANMSNTPWFFAVFAKLWLDSKFDWSWQPDRLQVPKHYIFQARNSINNLVYGHQAMIAYNKKLVLANECKGLDFTLDDPHAVVDILSGEAKYATDAWTIWRTAFREAIKLSASNDEISKSRLKIWCSVGSGYEGEWNIKGALDGVEYYTKVQGNHDLLRLSYEWKWLREKFNEKYT